MQQDQGTALITVRDNGIGIPEQLLPRIFDLFAQGERSLARSEGGLGIGLTLVRRLVEMHRGTVAARSEGHNLGSEFVVRLPLATQATARPRGGPRRGRRDAGERCGACSWSTITKTRPRPWRCCWSLPGHESRVARDGPSALALAATFRPHAVLLDIGLPEMDGYEVATRMQEIPGLAGVTLVAVTGYGQDDDRRRTTGAGFSYHLVKPVDPAMLERVISAIPLA